MNKEELIQEVYDGIKAVAFKQAHNKEQAKDFMQEGLISALEAIDKYPDKPERELILIIAKSAYNKIYSIQSRDITYERKNPNSADNIVIPSKEDLEKDYESRNFLAILKTRLHSRERKILEEHLNPSNRVIGVYEKEKRSKLRRRSRGQLVMNIHTNTIRSHHIAEAMGISKATMSRAFKAIRNEAEKLTDCLPRPPEST